MANQRNLVLIVDDDKAVRDALQFALRLEGLCVHVHNGSRALLSDPDLGNADCIVLSDWMPPVDGFDVLGHLRERDIGSPAIMLTSHATPSVRARAAAAGVEAVLEKPLLDNALMDNIRRLLASTDGREHT